MLKRIHLLQKKLQAIVLRATVGGHVHVVETAISIFLDDFIRGRSSSKDILDIFPEDLDVKVYNV